MLQPRGGKEWDTAEQLNNDKGSVSSLLFVRGC